MQNPFENPGYVDPTDLQRIWSIASSIKKRINDLLCIRPGIKIIDVGCGPGFDTVSLAELIGETGLVVGVDYDENMIHEAIHLTKSLGLEHRVFHIKADACAIPNSSNSFDACRCERLFQHVQNGEKVFKEIVRITKRGGRIVVADTDWATLSIDSGQPYIERRIALFRAQLFHNGYAGRQIYRMMKHQCLQNVIVEAHPIIWRDYHVFYKTSFSLNNFEKRLIESRTVNEFELQAFLSDLRDAQKQGVFYANANVIVTSGTKSHGKIAN